MATEEKQTTDPATDTMDPKGKAFQTMALAVANEGEKGEASVPDVDAEGESPSLPETLETDPGKLQSEVKGLHKEITRIREKNREGSGNEGRLLERIAKLEGQVEATSRSATQSQGQQYTVEQLLDMQTDWEDVLADSRVVQRTSQSSGDNEAAAQAEERALKAKGQLSAIRKEIRRKDSEATQQKADSTATRDVAVGQATKIVAAFVERHPEITDKDSDLWKASNTVFQDNRELLEPMGALGEMVAAVAAYDTETKDGVVTAKAARKNLLQELDTTGTKSLLKGAAKGKVTSQVDFEELVSKPGGVEKFERIMEKVLEG